ncbi:LacI family transcriptional regulator [Arthrobacter sp. I2-34]|uniref:LacI family transcriptional regulator n=1 Tax=Arthrobacter hankyongi TaxID=2904801 RepID=A0ABS9L984_9MICC|nr:LacI family DNA-binding transcriptional regulator [Arthrobacter hankyongi]MCG2623024.1 LacI family transcriptional regulator [Arthrobacter hankyongi]
MVSIADVASLAGVSPTTVSHAISGKRKVSDKVRRRVEAAMAELGYLPHRAAQNLALGTTRIIALLVPDIGNEFFAVLAKGAEEIASSRGYNILLCNTGFNHEREVLYLEMLRGRAVDGVIYAAGAEMTGRELTRLLGAIPLVHVDEEIEDSQTVAVVSDNTAGGRLVADHLLAHGHRRALILAGEAHLISSTQRVEGFLSVWNRAGGSAEISRGTMTIEGGTAAFRQHSRDILDKDMTAVFAINDLMAHAAIQELRSLGLRVPEDVSVVGFDDISLAARSHPSITSVRQDITGLGAAAVEVLLDSLEHKSAMEPHREVLPVTLVMRESSGRSRTGPGTVAAAAGTADA